MQRKAHRPFSKSEWFLLFAPLLVLAGFGLYAVLHPLFPRVLRGHIGEIELLRFSSNGTKLIVVSRDFKGAAPKSELRLWDVPSESTQWSNFLGGSYYSARFSPDDQTILYSHEVNSFSQICLRNTSAGKALFVIPGYFFCDFLGKHQFVVGSIGNTQIRDINSAEVHQTFSGTANHWPWGRDWDGCNNNFVMLTTANTSKSRLSRPVIWDISTHKMLSMLPKGQWSSVQFVNNHTLILSETKEEPLSISTNLQVWDLKAGRRLRTLARQTDFYHLSRDKSRLAYLRKLGYVKNKAFVSQGCEITMISVPSGKLEWSVKADFKTGYLTSDYAAKFLLSLENKVGDQRAVLRDGKTGAVLAEYLGVTTCNISPDGQTVATGDAKGVVHLYDTRHFLN